MGKSITLAVLVSDSSLEGKTFMKRAIFALVLGFASLANADIVSPLHILWTGVDSWGITLPNGMASSSDGSGGYWALVGTATYPVTGGVLAPDAPDASRILGDSGVLDIGIPYGIYGYFGSTEQTWSATPGVFVDSFNANPWYAELNLYLIDDALTTATFIERPYLTPIMVMAEAGGPYRIGPGETMILDGSASAAYQGGP
jgi:hypothetical protein